MQTFKIFYQHVNGYDKITVGSFEILLTNVTFS